MLLFSFYTSHEENLYKWPSIINLDENHILTATCLLYQDVEIDKMFVPCFRFISNSPYRFLFICFVLKWITPLGVILQASGTVTKLQHMFRAIKFS